MNKNLKVFHIAITIFVWAMLIASLIFLASRWNKLPDKIGVHFNPPTGELDLFDNKIYSLYPYIVGFGTLFVLEIAGILSKWLKSGMKINVEGEKKFRVAVCILLDMVKICLSVFGVNWADCVIRQKNMNVKIPELASEIVRMAFVLFIVIMIVIRIKYRERQSDKHA